MFFLFYNTLLGRCLPPPHPWTELPNLFYPVASVISFLKWTSVKVVENGFLIRVLHKTVFRTETKNVFFSA